MTQCVQRDFLRPLAPGEPLPNLVHVGQLEAERLAGPEGALVPFLLAAHRADPADLGIVHLVDRHDPTRHAAHFDLFRPHCVAGTEGAELLDPLPGLAAARPGTRVVVAGDLNDAEDSDLFPTLFSLADDEVDEIPIGVVGVFTDVKVAFLLYDLATRLRAKRLATCSALTASRSLRAHFAALEHLREVLGVAVFHSPGEFGEWLGLPPAAALGAPGAPRFRFAAASPAPGGWSGEDEAERDALLDRLCPGTVETVLSPLGGGFSGAQVFLARDGHGAASVVKAGPRAEVAVERFGNERVRRILGDAVPALLGHAEGRRLAAMRVELADSDDPSAARPSTFKRLWESDPSDAATSVLEESLRRVLGEQLGRFYRTAEKDNADLLEAYGFVDARGRPRWAESVAARAEEIARGSGANDAAALIAGMRIAEPWLAPAGFYGSWLPGRSMREEVLSAPVHGDLNLANVLVARRADDGRLHRTWVIDFARLTRLPALTDFAKVENDLCFLLLPLAGPEAEERAMAMQEVRLASPGLLPDGLDALAVTPAERRWARVVLVLRRLAAEIDPRGEVAVRTYRVALLRYAAHTLGFDEATLGQRRLALAGVARLCGLLAAGEARP